MSELQWRKSSRSGGGAGNNCVEVAPLTGSVAVRDSKDPNGPALAVARSSWTAFISEVRTNALGA